MVLERSIWWAQWCKCVYAIGQLELSVVMNKPCFLLPEMQYEYRL